MRFLMCKLGILMLFICISVSAQNEEVRYQIQRGENIESIATRFGVSVEEIDKANPNSGGLYFAGMKIIIPVNGGEINPHKQNSNVAPDSNLNNAKNESVNNNIVYSHDALGESNVKVPLPVRLSSNNYVKRASTFLRLQYQSDAEMYGLDYGMDFSNYLFGKIYFQSNLKFDGESTSIYGSGLAVGAKQRFVFGDAFLVQAELYPYIGLGSQSTPKNVMIGQEGSEDIEFTYGMGGNIGFGFKLWNTPKGNATFLTASYDIYAGEFETEGLFKYGYVSLGIITILGE